MIYLLAAILLIYSENAELIKAQTVLIHPQSRLIPVGEEAVFICKFTDVDVNYHRPYWKIDKTHAHINTTKDDLRNMGFFIAPKAIHGRNITLSLRVNASYYDVNNTVVQCTTRYNDLSSDVATIMTIMGSPVSPNPRLEQPNVTHIEVKWSPPFLWPGYFIERYNITVEDISGNISFYLKNSILFSDAVVSFWYNDTNQQHCLPFMFGITPIHSELLNQTHFVKGGYLSPLGNFTTMLVVLFKANGTPVVRVRIVPSTSICSYQWLNYTLTLEDKEETFTVTEGPFSQVGHEKFEHDLTSDYLKRRQEYFMTIMVNSEIEQSYDTHAFNTYMDSELVESTVIVPCTTGPTNGADSERNWLKYILGVCISVVVLMVFMLISVLLCLFILHHKKRSHAKTFNESTSRVHNAMVHNPIYDGPVYESVLERRFDSLASVSAQDYSSSNTSACHSPGSHNATPPDTDSFHKNPRYLDRPIQLRSLGLSQHSSDSNNTSQCTTVSVPATTTMMSLKKNGKERNKLHLTLTLNSQNETCPNPVTSKVHPSASAVVANNIMSEKRTSSCMNPVIVMTSSSNLDTNYTVMTPATGSMKAEAIELSPEDSEKYKE